MPSTKRTLDKPQNPPSKRSKTAECGQNASLKIEKWKNIWFYNLLFSIYKNTNYPNEILELISEYIKITSTKKKTHVSEDIF